MAATTHSLNLLRDSILREIEVWIDRNPHCPRHASVAVDQLLMCMEAFGAD